MTATIEEVSGKTFDFVIVGGGTAGLILANRLTEDSVSVLVLEAGDANLADPAILTPGTFGSQFGNPQYEWGYATEQQPHCNNRAVPWPRGKGLGGSSGINFFQYHYPSKSDINAFESLGNAGWNWDLLKKYQKKSERFIPPAVKEETMSYDLAEHGTDGPLTTAYVTTPSGLESPYHNTLANLGIQRAKDPLSGDHTGTWLTPMTIHPELHVRTYAANAYYSPVADRKNLTVLTLARVARIESTTNANGILTATGVQFIHNDATHTAHAGREVILSAGSLIDPQILELSGIGNKEVLNKFGIPVKLEIPGVGSNIQEHVHCGATFEIREDKHDDVLTFDCLRDPVELGKQIQLIMTEGKGVFGMGLSMMSFLPLAKISPNADAIYADLEKAIKDGIAAKKYSPLYIKQFEIQLQSLKNGQANCETLLAQAAAPVPGIAQPGKKYISLSSLLNNPFSRGTIHIKSTNPLDFPAFDPHYFEEEYGKTCLNDRCSGRSNAFPSLDIRLLVEIFKFNRRVAQTEPLASFLKPTEVFPGPDVKTDDQIANYIKNTIGTVYHTVGSCSLLPFKDGGVVDTKLKVYNTTNLRVVDASIIPLHVGAHIQAITFAIGEIGADIIKGKI